MTAHERANPQEVSRFDFGGAALRRGWPRLHAGDLEPWPEGRGAAAVQAAWRAFHEGRFAEAIDAGTACGAAGAAVANKAAGVHATYSALGAADATTLLRAAIARGEAAVLQQPEHANAHYGLAFVLGRYGQRISVAKALADGLGGRVRVALQRTLALQPGHAEAHVALGVFHAEVVDKVGALAARIGYGASREASIAAFERARALAPLSPVACLEYARALRRLDPKAAARARALLESAVAIEPADAMEALDVNAARAELRAG